MDNFLKEERSLLLAKRYMRSRKTTIAVPFFLRAAKLGSAEAFFCLGIIFSVGVGISPRKKAAKKYFQAAVKLGHPHACEALSSDFGWASIYIKETDQC